MLTNRRKSGRVREKSRVGAMPAVGYIPQNLREDGGVDSYSNSPVLSRARDVRHDAE